MTDVSVRRAAPEELPEAAALYERVARATLPWLPPESQSAATFLEAAAEEAVFVAVAAGRIVGLAALYEPEHFLHSLFVDADWQGQGVGLALLKAAASAAAGPLSLKVQLRNTGARRFYAREGFQEADGGGEGDAAWVRLVRGV
ncbi:MAG: GNAT family N-acetyltransferase [Alphaproteobacteria bacterium]